MIGRKNLVVFMALVLATAVSLTVWSGSAQAQNGSNNFQFNELDFDRQGTGQGPASQNQAPSTQMLSLPGDSGGAPDPDAGLADLFSGDPVSPTGQGSIQNLPGEPSPVSTPAAQGEAKIELADGKSPASTAKKGVTRRRTGASKGPSFRNIREKRFYYAMQAWRGHPELRPVNCQSYLTERPLYDIRCLGTLAKRIK